MSGAAVILSAVAGLAVGPVLRRLVDQVPDRLPVLEPPARQLVPVVSWFDTEPAGTRYLVGSPDDRGDLVPATDAVARWRAPAVDLGAALLLAVLAARIGWNWALPAYLTFGAALVAVTVVDLDHYRIPDRLVFPALGLSLVFLSIAAVGHDLTGALWTALIGAAAYFVFLFVFFFVWPQGMGFGDVKLALLLGLHLAWAGTVVDVDGVLVHAGAEFGLRLVLLGALFGSALGAVLGVGMLVVTRRKGAFPFGPALCLGAVAAIVFSDQLLT